MRQAVIIVVPCYNEARRLDAARISEFARSAPGTQLLLVDDGSTDDTFLRLERLHHSYPTQIDAVRLPQNVGKAEAVRQGLLRASERRPVYLGYWDADLATPLQAIPAFCDVLDRKPHVDLVLGSRMPLLGRQIRRKPHRKLLGRTFAWCASQVLGLPVYDTQCGAKLFRNTPTMLGLFESPFLSRWIFDVELLARLICERQSTGKGPVEQAVYEFPLDDWHDVEGSKLRPRDFLRAIMELARIGRTYRRKPAHEQVEFPAPVPTGPLPETQRSNRRAA